MYKEHLSDYLIKYTFDPHGNMKYGYNIYAVVGTNNQVIILDCAYEIHSTLVKEDLLRNGYQINSIVISHFHTDHFAGMISFDDIQIIGSEDYIFTFNELYKNRDLKAFAPTILISDGKEIEIAGVKFQFFKGKGHSECSLITVINNEFIHVGDLLIADTNGKPILPLIGKKLIKHHIEALKLISKFNNHTLLLSHGNPITGEENIYYEVLQRILYLESLQEGDNNISIEKALSKCDMKFINLHWHETNLKNL